MIFTLSDFHVVTLSSWGDLRHWGVPIKSVSDGCRLPSLPHKIKFSQKVSIFAILSIYKYSLSILLSFCQMGWHRKKKILTKEELQDEIKVIIKSLYEIPSMSDKLPNYIYNRIESVIEYVKEKGW